MSGSKTGSAEFDINEFGKWVQENFYFTLTLTQAKYVEYLMDNNKAVSHVRATGKAELERLLKEYLDEVQKD